jgi:hypothetical protein
MRIGLFFPGPAVGVVVADRLVFSDASSLAYWRTAIWRNSASGRVPRRTTSLVFGLKSEVRPLVRTGREIVQFIFLGRASFRVAPMIKPNGLCGCDPRTQVVADNEERIGPPPGLGGRGKYCREQPKRNEQQGVEKSREMHQTEFRDRRLGGGEGAAVRLA